MIGVENLLLYPRQKAEDEPPKAADICVDRKDISVTKSVDAGPTRKSIVIGLLVHCMFLV